VADSEVLVMVVLVMVVPVMVDQEMVVVKDDVLHLTLLSHPMVHVEAAEVLIDQAAQEIDTTKETNKIS
jgi:hypothetical protein